MRIELFNDGTAKITKGIKTTDHTYVLNENQDRCLYTIEIDGGVVVRAKDEPVEVVHPGLTTENVMEQPVGKVPAKRKGKAKL